jgi:hypothetical protein
MRGDTKRERLSWFLDFIQTDLDSLSRGEKIALLDEFERHVKKAGPVQKALKEAGIIEFDLEKSTREAKETQRHLKTFLDEMFKDLENGRPHGPIDFSIEIFALPIEGKISIIFNTYWSYGIFDLLVGLRDLPLEAIRKCPMCERYFLHLSKRRRTYCSPRCTSKAHAEKRKSDPEAYKKYLKKQKQIMRRKYETEQKRKLGPRVKVRRKG